ncbi:hypothetical protein C7293_05560 [filamentous cyanobacterium CCT1]|nr:hypothetical protein C7293_05560 [filamentous cyanobacterium CCT1]PSN81040.1 hypothetical protein C8B47_03480 [filamentous cyanobacterium CCP4]
METFSPRPTLNLTKGLITIQALKRYVHRYWAMAHRSRMAVVQEENFLPEVRSLFGDLRLKHTWERAYSHFFVNWVVGCAVEADTYFGVLDPSQWEDWAYELRFLTLEAIAAHPETKSLTSNALSYLVRYERESLASGFIALVEESTRRQGSKACQTTVLQGFKQMRR